MTKRGKKKAWSPVLEPRKFAGGNGPAAEFRGSARAEKLESLDEGRDDDENEGGGDQGANKNRQDIERDDRAFAQKGDLLCHGFVLSDWGCEASVFRWRRINHDTRRVEVTGITSATAPV